MPPTERPTSAWAAPWPRRSSMTHTLHRVGDPTQLSEDFVILMMPSKDINHQGSGPKLQRMMRLCLENGAIEVGDARLGNEHHQGGRETMIDNIEDRAVIQAVFDNEADLTRALKALKEADEGISVVVSGLFDRVRECCQEVGLTPHTVNQSLGRWGRTEKLPDDARLELNTMCGHGMVALGLIDETIEQVKKGEMTPEQAGKRLFKPCQCGIFNTHRAARIVGALAGG